MFVVSTVGPDNVTKTVAPFVTGTGAVERGETVDLFLMQEATYLASENHVDLSELVAPGMPPVAEVVKDLQEDDGLGECVVCKPCSSARGIGSDDLREWATLGGPADLARLAADHETSIAY